MKTKANIKYRVLTDEELKAVTGGLVQLINPSHKCREYTNEKDCLAAHKYCRWKFDKKECFTVD